MRYVVSAALAALLACGCGGGSGSSTPSSITVTGIVVDYTSSEPVEGVAVVLGDQGPVLTDANGAFTLADVELPYTAMVFDDATPTAVVYQGLTRSDPTLVRRRRGAWTWTGTLEGTASGGVGLPLPANHTTRVFGAVGRRFTSSGPANDATGEYTRSVGWYGSTQAEVTLTALQYEHDNDKRLVAVTGYGVLTSSLIAGQTLTMQDIVLDPVLSTVGFDGTIAAPPGQAMGAWLGIVPPQSGVLSLPRKAGVFPAYALEGPTIAGALYDVNTQATRQDGSSTVGTHFDVAPGTTGIVTVLPSAPYLVVPAPGVGAVDYTTTFASTPVADSVYEFSFGSSLGTIFVLSASEQTTVPDLTGFGMGLVPTSSYIWAVGAYGPYSSLDDAAGSGGYERPATGFRVRAQSAARSFTAAP